jgi:hypothetical protein
MKDIINIIPDTILGRQNLDSESTCRSEENI